MVMTDVHTTIMCYHHVPRKQRVKYLLTTIYMRQSIVLM